MLHTEQLYYRQAEVATFFWIDKFTVTRRSHELHVTVLFFQEALDQDLLSVSQMAEPSQRPGELNQSLALSPSSRLTRHSADAASLSQHTLSHMSSNASLPVSASHFDDKPLEQRLSEKRWMLLSSCGREATSALK